MTIIASEAASEQTTPADRYAAVPHHRVAIVGAGFAGLGTAIRLQQAGIEDFMLLEKADEVGGTWQANTYPGCQCDVPSHLYSFSFALNPDWSRSFSTQPEIWEYLKRCANEYGVREKVSFDTELLDAAWSEMEQLWRLETSQGPLTAEILVSGMGLLCEPSLPSIEGLERFTGPCFHSARWDHSVKLEGKRVAVIGTGASSVQLVPKIQPLVSELRLFQRTPPWVLPHPDRTITAAERWLYERLPAAQRLMRECIYWGREMLLLPMFLHPLLCRPVEAVAKRHMRRQIADPQLRKQLTPSYRIGCKRVLLSDDYYPAIEAENTQLVTAPIERVTEQGILTRDGVEHKLDAIVLSTGFRVTDVPYASLLKGRDGRSLAEAWQGSPKAHLGSTVSGFPNLFLLLGPYTALGHTSVVFMIECQIAYLLDCLKTMDHRRLQAIEPRADAQQAFLEEMRQKAKRTVWLSGGCASWYLDSEGAASAIWPGPTWRFRQRLKSFEPGEYILRPRTTP